MSTSVPSSGLARCKREGDGASDGAGGDTDRNSQPLASTNWAKVAMRRMPSVRCVHDSVAPLMLAMSSLIASGAPRRLAVELVAPGLGADFAAVRFAIGEDLDVLDLALRRQRDGIVDQLELADDAPSVMT